MVRDVVAGRYELEELVGSVGMSSVFRARDRVLERIVALKVLHSRQLVDDEEYVERFRREAQMVAGLLHHNIVTVIDRGEDDGTPFIVFEYVGGREPEAARPAGEGRWPVERALDLCDPDRAWPGLRPSEGHRPSRRQAAERHAERDRGWSR